MNDDILAFARVSVDAEIWGMEATLDWAPMENTFLTQLIVVATPGLRNKRICNEFRHGCTRPD